jgi:hypothetical protein
MVSLQAYQATGTFNPLGVILRRWEIDSLHIASGSVMLQKTEPLPGAPKGTPWPPWWAIFWPYRVHLADVKVGDANILWHLQDKESGIYSTHLEITPNGRDYEYDAQGGVIALPGAPKLGVKHAHMLIRKPMLTCDEFVVGEDLAAPTEEIRLSGTAGLQDDRSMHLKIAITKLGISSWLPPKLKAHVTGQANGSFNYDSTGTGLETGKGEGTISVDQAVLNDLDAVHKYVTLTGSPDPGPMALKVCHMDVKWEAGAMTAQNIEVECEGVFRLTGTLTIAKDKSLSGQVEFGLTDPYLKWLPTARSAIFTRDEGPYHFATVHFSGTGKKPVEDLSPRVAREVGKSPLTAMKLFFNQAGSWFDFD